MLLFNELIRFMVASSEAKMLLSHNVVGVDVLPFMTQGAARVGCIGDVGLPYRHSHFLREMGEASDAAASQMSI